MPRASDDPPREKRSRISRADPLEVARAVALSEFTLPSRPNFDRDRYWIRQTDLMVEMDLQWKRKIGRLIGET